MRMQGKTSKSFICVYCSVGELFGEVALLRLYSFLNFQVPLDQFTLGNFFVNPILFLYGPGGRSWFSQMYLSFGLIH